MKLYLMRHAHAQPGGDSDVSRRLSPLGEDQAIEAGKMLAAREERPTIVYASPYVRARLTAGIVSDCLRLSDPKVTDYLSIDSNQRQILQLVNESMHEQILLVGHEPHLREFASLLLSGDRHSRVGFGNVTTYCIETPKPAAWETGRIEWKWEIT